MTDKQHRLSARTEPTNDLKNFIHATLLVVIFNVAFSVVIEVLASALLDAP